MTAPTDEQVLESVKSYLSSEGQIESSELGRIQSTLELENDWTLTEKRLKSVLVKSSLLAAAPAPAPAPKSKKKKKAVPSHVPRSFIDPSVALPDGVEARYFDAVKGKGLVASRDLAEGSVVFTEEAFVPTPPPSAVESMLKGEICTQCFLPTETGGKSCNKCPARFCSILCQSRAMATHHALLCEGHNPSIKPLMQIIAGQSWQSLHSVARSVARLLLTCASSPAGTFEQTDSQISSFATVSELERRARNPGWALESDSFQGVLANAHSVLRDGLDPFLARKNAVRPDLIEKHKRRVEEILAFPSFLQMLGRSNINMESHGGLYLVHSFLNHDCSPNVQIRHVPVKGRLASMKIAAVALRPIGKGEELVISYVDPKLSVARRRLVLWRDYCFGPCTCARCTEELQGLTEQERRESENPQAELSKIKQGKDEVKKDLSGLEDELRESLGL